MSIADVGAKLGPYMPLILLLTALAVGVPLVFRHWRDPHETEEPASTTELLTDLLQAEDKMTDAEFRRVRELLVGAKGVVSAKPRLPAVSRPSPDPAMPETGATGESEPPPEPMPPAPPA